jgi:general secretion pathway protein J
MTPRRRTSSGFTLIESLIALAITSLVVLSCVTFLRDGAYYFDRGTEAVDQTEQFAFAVDCLTRDFAGARFVLQAGPGGPVAPFVADGRERILFVTAADRASATQGEEVVEYSVEEDGELSRLVRRRAPWAGPRSRPDDVAMTDPVALLRGPFEISFQYSELTPEGALVWYDRWSGSEGLPYSVRLALVDRATGVDLLGGSAFRVRANAPASCASGKEDCLSFRKTSASLPQSGLQRQTEAAQ